MIITIINLFQKCLYYFVSFLFPFYLIYYFFLCCFVYFYYYYYFVFFGNIFYIKYSSKIRAARIIVPYNNGSKAPIRLSGRGRFCLAFARSGMFGLDIVPKEKLSRLVNISFHSGIDLCLETWLWSPLTCMEYALVGMDIGDYVNTYNLNLYFYF